MVVIPHLMRNPLFPINSDDDVLVVFEGKGNFDLFMELKFYLEELLGTQVNLVTDKTPRPQIRKAIEQEMIHVA